MSKVLFIKSSPLPEQYSRSTQIAKFFIEEYLKANPDDTVEELDLYQLNMPLIDQEVMNAQMKLQKGIPLTEAESAKLAEMSNYTEQFMNADKFVFASPLWNLGMPPLLKAYIDLVSVAGKTFDYTDKGPIGLLNNKIAIHFHGCGGIYSDKPHVTFADSYLHGILKFLGVDVLPTIFVEGIDQQPDKEEEIMNQAKGQAKAALKDFTLNFSTITY